MSIKHEKVCAALNYIEHLLILASAVTGCITISDFDSSLGIPIGIMSSSIGLKIYGITAEIKEYKSINKKDKKKHGKILLLAKAKLNNIEALISKGLMDSNISHDEIS